MQKISKSKLSFIKIICMCFIFILLSGIGVMAVTTKLNSVTIKFNDGKEMIVLTSKNNVKDILDENNIILSENEKISPNLEENITIDENGDPVSDCAVSFFNPNHICALLCNYSALKEDC